jgi:luciferase family oxidoreductase group 1
LTAFLDGSFPAGHPYQRIQAVPAGEAAPAMWLLGSSDYSAQVAGLLGLPFAFAHHFRAVNMLPALEQYRARFRPSDTLAEPYAMIGVALVAADTDKEARWLHGSSQLSMVRLRTGRPGPLPSPEEAHAYGFTPSEKALVESTTGTHIVGGPQAVAQQLDALIEATGADEIMVTTNVHDHAARLHSYEIVAALAGLDGRPVPVTAGAETG